MAEIVNRVAESKLITFDLEDLYPQGERVLLDISEWLLEGFLLREKDFRENLKAHDWNRYKDAYVALTCTTDAIIPAWAFMLITAYLTPVAKKTVIGNLTDLETALYREILEKEDFSRYKDQYVIVKGCSKKPVPQDAYIQAVGKLQPLVKNLMYGEACSSVPLFKKK